MRKRREYSPPPLACARLQGSDAEIRERVNEDKRYVLPSSSPYLHVCARTLEGAQVVETKRKEKKWERKERGEESPPPPPYVQMQACAGEKEDCTNSPHLLLARIRSPL